MSFTKSPCSVSCTTAFVALIVGIVIGLLLDLRSCSGPTVIDKWHYDTVYVRKHDTTVISKPVVAWRTVHDIETIEVPLEVIQTDTNCKPFAIRGDTVRLQDSALVVPTFSYPSCEFKLWYRPPVEKVITITHEREIIIPPKVETFTIGAGVSYGPSLVNGGVYFAPSISVGLYYKLLGF